MRTLVVMPMYNEEPTLARVVEAVRRFIPPNTDILVVDDGSLDRSPQILAAFPEVIVIRHPENQGYGASLIDGFQYAIEDRYDAVVTMDCDDQHEPFLIPDLLAALHEADIVSGSRYLPGSSRGQDPPPDRLKINREITAKINEITGFGITDAWCGFKAYRVEALRLFEIDETSYGMPLQVWIQAKRYKLGVREIPIGRLYVNPDRRFWGGLDDADTRRAYYLDVLDRAVSRWLEPAYRPSGGRPAS
ncbi:MAG: glycosyltransferase family 2 protein [Armatimonadetes bacterium]|nr:glycosyltransferase family 2 protein [Armatimonadota bacterium]